MSTDYNDLNIYQTPRGGCPLCGSNGLALLYEIKNYSPNFKVDRCSSCGFIFMNPLFQEGIFKSMYEEDYYSGKAEYSYCDERRAKKYFNYVWDKRIEIIRKYVSSGNFLDIGSSFGGLLESASRYYKPFGIEVSGYASNYSKRIFGESIHNGTIHDHPFSSDFFSVITMVELIEHIEDPAFAIKECYKLLKDGGVLLVQTANMNGLQARILGDKYAYYMPGHISYFSAENLCDLLKKAGFKRVKVFYPVEFGLLPKLLKSRNSFESKFDYFKWLKIASYHMLGKIHFNNFAMMSSMVVFAFR